MAMNAYRLSHMKLSPGSVRCELCGGRLSWQEDRRLDMIVEAMSDHYASNHSEHAALSG